MLHLLRRFFGISWCEEKHFFEFFSILSSMLVSGFKTKKMCVFDLWKVVFSLLFFQVLILKLKGFLKLFLISTLLVSLVDIGGRNCVEFGLDFVAVCSFDLQKQYKLRDEGWWGWSKIKSFALHNLWMVP